MLSNFIETFEEEQRSFPQAFHIFLEFHFCLPVPPIWLSVDFPMNLEILNFKIHIYSQKKKKKILKE